MNDDTERFIRILAKYGALAHAVEATVGIYEGATGKTYVGQTLYQIDPRDIEFVREYLDERIEAKIKQLVKDASLE